MPFANLKNLKAWLPENHYFFDEETPDSLEEAFKQADSIIKSYTGQAAPADTADADPIYTAIACRIVLYMSSGENVSEQEMTRRKTLYDQAFAELKEIAADRIDPAKDNSDNVEPGFFSQEKRIELL